MEGLKKIEKQSPKNRGSRLVVGSIGWFLFALFVFGLSTFHFQLEAASAASPPATITYQGKLLNSNNSAVTTTVSAKFVLYSSLTGGTALYTASGTLPTTSTISITPTNGLFSVNFGDTGTNSLDPTIFQNNQTVYLEVTIAGETLSPRKQITASPFAYNAKYLDGIAATSTASTSVYIPISDANGNFNFNTVSSAALRDALGWLQNQGGLAKLQIGTNNGGFGGGATPGNLTMTSTDFSFFNSAAVNADSKGFVGSAFDGRYIYFVPNSTGQITRYDTTASFSATSSYSFFDAATNVTTTAKGFEGAVFDGRYVYFIPNSISGVRSGVVLRYDITAAFSAASSWTAYDTAANVSASSKGFIGAVFDGRYIYLVPTNNGAYFGQVTRFDTTAPFSTASSWSVFDTATVNANSVGYTGAVFDGQYIYFVPNSLPSGDRHGQIGRFDTTKSFTAAGSWSFFNTAALNSNSKGFVFGAFDGRYIYFSPLKTDNITFSGLVTRYDTAASFSVSSSYAFFDATTVHSNSKGFSGATFDGRYLYFIPDRTANGVDSGQITRYDTSQPFSTSGSWSVYDMTVDNANAKGYEGAVFDGRYLYLAPYRAGAGGLVARLRVYAGGVDSAQGLTKLARGSDLFIDSAGNIGLGTTDTGSTSTAARLTIIGGSIMASGTTGVTPGSGAGTRLMWIPAKAAFRAGAVSSTEWDDSNIGINSTALGLKATASGRHSLAWGVNSIASSDHTLALGELAAAGGVSAIALGTGASSSATYSMAMGWFSAASGIYSTAIGGIQPIASATSAIAIGSYVTASASGSMALGRYITVNGENSVGIGLDTTARTISAANTFAVVGGRALFGTSTAPGTNYQMFIDSGASTNPGLGVNGYVQASGFITGTTTLDLAELYPIEPNCADTNTCPEPGDAVCVVSGATPATIAKCSVPYSQNAIGIISANPGFTLGGLGNSATRKVALAGRVPLKVLGPVKIGDRLTTSDTPGVAQVASAPGPTIGIALADEPSVGATTVLVLVNVALSLSEPSAAVSTSSAHFTFDFLTDWLKQLGVAIINGIVSAKEFIAEKITGSTIIAREHLCVGQTCITEDQLKQILGPNQIVTTPVSNSNDQTVTAPAIAPVTEAPATEFTSSSSPPASTSTVDATSDPAATSTLVVDSAPAPTPADNSTPTSTPDSAPVSTETPPPAPAPEPDPAPVPTPTL